MPPLSVTGRGLPALEVSVSVPMLLMSAPGCSVRAGRSRSFTRVAASSSLAAKAAGRENQMKFIGIDALPQEGVGYVQQGILDVTFQYPTGGAEAIETALKILHAETVPKEIVLGTRRFDKDNVAQGGEELR